MNIYHSKYSKLSGSSYHEIEAGARRVYESIKRKSKRKPYIRSKYFNNHKIFIDYYWAHLNQKPRRERFRRLPFYRCGIDLLENSMINPYSRSSSDHPSQILFRFYGKTKLGVQFCVQVKQHKNGQKHLMSIFPYK